MDQKKQKILANISVLLFQDHGLWIAQCMDYDIAAHGQTIEDALNSFERIFLGQIILDVKSNRTILGSTPETPERFKNKFEDAKRLQEKKSFNIPKELISIINGLTSNDVRVFA